MFYKINGTPYIKYTNSLFFKCYVFSPKLMLLFIIWWLNTFWICLFQLNLMKNIRESIKQDKFPQFVNDFFHKMYPEKEYPKWAVEALKTVYIHISWQIFSLAIVMRLRINKLCFVMKCQLVVEFAILHNLNQLSSISIIHILYPLTVVRCAFLFCNETQKIKVYLCKRMIKPYYL